mmetsp:Transcript_25831/g.74735  ORF Transcript_25831/g.74735 Transcript_25831/m.74735 type:complete len:356 (+) Transcript_25831:179-1246(+)
MSSFLLVVGWSCILAFFFTTASYAYSYERPPSAALRVMTYNVHAWRDCSHVDNFERVVEAVRAVKPDICCLNEVLHPFVAPQGSDGLSYYEDVKDGKGRDLTLPSDHLPSNVEDSFLYRMSKDTGLEYLEYGAADPVDSSFGKVPFGNAILSRFAIKNYTHVPLKVDEGDIELGFQKRDIVDPRQAIVATLDVDGKFFGLISTHLDQKSEELRGKQAMKVVKAANDILSPEYPTIICGDFNSFRRRDMDEATWKDLCDLYESRSWGRPNEVSLVLKALENDGYAETFSFSKGQYPKPTCWTNIPVMRIDHMLVKSPPVESGSQKSLYDIKALSHQRVEVDGSDHFPIFVDFEIIE